jgi:SAM-dependent methyltransferase
MSLPSDVEATIAYYDEHAEEYARSTLNIDVRSLYAPFLALIAERGHILDAGCGSGRDTKFFLDHGFTVTACDGSSAMARTASSYTGLRVSVVRVQDLTYADEFDGIWACASLLHVCRADLVVVFRNLERALRPRGVLYASFKHGDSDRFLGGRRFTDFTSDQLQSFVTKKTSLDIVSVWDTPDQRPDCSNNLWVNLLARRQ